MKLISYIFSISFSVLILMNSFWASVNYLYYELDPVGFIEKLCENIDKPELECNGKCHLKKVAESQNKSHKTPENLIDFKDLLLFIEILVKPENKNIYYTNRSLLIGYVNLYTFNVLNAVFHPPRFV
ncbi:hypothetical protein J4050_04305 [Winogradskyella sp. DF17]|uniref:Uncharacterized protein n=1 Tax=Winogradskyella pelagia TaxID=2819984 RepID=A0ABS3T0I5_9FLAO|nr:hypothetical protein [Winogradskyella sp. DF17]MBO3115954.1 hypothetical protein [Winogradskyella sp. DF17]